LATNLGEESVIGGDGDGLNDVELRLSLDVL
jgi:hypothetical protein